MFDIGFWELSLIGVVALLVIGPERLPGVARNVGKWMGTAKRFVHSVQEDINTEVGKADELKQRLEEQSQVKSLHEILEEATRDESHRGPVPRAKPDYEVKAVDHDAGQQKPLANGQPVADKTPPVKPAPVSAGSPSPQQKHD